MHIAPSMTQIVITAPGGPEMLVPATVPTPLAGAGEILIKVEAAGINRPDVMQRQGVYPMPPGVTVVPGLEVAGHVVALGEGATGHQIGDRVCALTNGGGYAQYCAVPAGQALAVPKGMNLVSAAALPETFFTVWANLFGLGGAAQGDEVLIHGGASGIGTTALMLCHELGIMSHAVVSSEEKAALVRKLGGQPILRRSEDITETILTRTGGRGVDVILDIAGGPSLKSNIDALAQDGRLVMIGVMEGTVADGIDVMKILAKRARITGSLMRARTVSEKSQIASDLSKNVWPILDAGRCHPIVSATFDLEKASDAHRAMETPSHAGKIILTVRHA